MKKLLMGLTIAAALSCIESNAISVFEATMNEISTDKIDRFPAYIVTYDQLYVNGGLIFTYPTGLFTTTPIITVSLFVTPHADNITYTAEISQESSTSATVMVYRDTSGVITQAATSEVTVYFFAIGT